jgi:nitroimidazol reductase NimA-like FMN-containing flavoprotein (pyridoxamine 5'-phosphate oxidase superfamily)
MPQRKLEELTEEECFALLQQEQVGRLVYVDELGPLAIPINFAVDGRTIVFRREGSERVESLPDDLAFEVDHVDSPDRSGWSVLVRGSAQGVELEAVPEMLHRMAGRYPSPWAEGHHNNWVAITPRVVTGRRLTAPYYAPLL